MDNNKEELLEKLKEIKETATRDIANTDVNKSEVVQNGSYYGEIELTRRDNGEKDKFELCTVKIYDYDNDGLQTKIYLNGQELNMGELMRTYENLNPIKDTINNPKKKKLDLNNLEAEKSRDEYAGVLGKDKEDIKKIAEVEEDKENKEKEENEVDEKKLTSITHLQEVKGETKVNNYQTMSQALGMTDVKKFVVVYSEKAAELSKNNGEDKSRNNSTYSIIAIKNDGTAINIDDKLELSRSEGTNSTEGRMQTDADGTTKEEYTQASIYNIKGTDKALSLENGTLGEIEVYYGSMTRGSGDNEGNRFVGTQLETRNVYPTSKDVRAQEDPKKGMHYADEKAEEVSKHLEHGDEEIKNIRNADGKEETSETCEHEENVDNFIKEDAIVPGKDKTFREWGEELGENATVLVERFKREVEKNPDCKPEKITEAIEDDYETIAR